MHTDVTLQLLEAESVELGSEFRNFIDSVCAGIQTKELAVEVAARRRREEKKLLKESKVAKQATKDADAEATDAPGKPTTGKVAQPTAKFVSLNIQTPKFHFLGDYASMIRMFGTTDSYSSERVSAVLYHLEYLLNLYINRENSCIDIPKNGSIARPKGTPARTSPDMSGRSLECKPFGNESTKSGRSRERK